MWRAGPSSASCQGKVLVLYSYHESADDAQAARVRSNLDYFVREGVLGPAAPSEAAADIVVIVNGGRLGVSLPRRVETFNRSNVGFEFCGVRAALDSSMLADRVRARDYCCIVLINDSVRGPFLPNFARGIDGRPSPVAWTALVCGMLGTRTKLVGSTVNCCNTFNSRHCRPGYIAPQLVASELHLQSFFLATDSPGLALIRPRLYCKVTKRAVVASTEVGISRRILDAGYNIASTMRFWHAHNFQDLNATQAKCATLAASGGHLDHMMPNGHFGFDPNPIELMFVKTNRGLRRDGTPPAVGQNGARYFRALEHYTAHR